MPAREPLPEHVTTPLLTVLTQNSLDEDYQHAADERERQGGGPPSSRGVAAVVVALFGILIVTAAVQTSRNAATDEAGRAELVGQINTRRAEVADRERSISSMRAENTRLSGTLDELAVDERAARNRTDELGAGTGFRPVEGEGVRLRVDDSPDGNKDGRVRDEDLAVLVDGLWAAGAEAVSVNGQRLTNVSPIRNVGEAIHIKSVPLRAPYTVLAVGNRNTMQARFGDSVSGIAWASLVNSFGFEFSMTNADSLQLPGSQTPTLRSAERAPEGPDKEVGQ
ncbi:MAG: DUF881 domain-containing protein [Nocardioides sp.]